MTTQSISIHRALTLINKTQDRLNVLIQTGTFVSTVQGTERRPQDRSFKTVTELENRIQSDTDSLESALSLIPKLKTAIAAKNLETVVDFKGAKVSITELLGIKSLIDYRRNYLAHLRNQSNKAQNAAEKAQQEVIKQLEQIDPSVKDTVRQNLEKVHLVELVSGTKESVAQKIDRITKENDFLENEIDIVLSETNLQTLIEVDM